MAIKTVTVKPSGGTYASLSAAIAGELTANPNLVSSDIQLVIECYAMVDTTAVVVNGFTTDATRYVRITAPAGERHSGKWNDAKYELAVSGQYAMSIGDDYTRVDHLQVYQTRTSIGDSWAILLADDVINVDINANILRGLRGSGVSTVCISNVGSGWGNNCVFRNNICFGFDGGPSINLASSSTGIFGLFNNTFYDMGSDGVNFRSVTTPNITVKNNIANHCAVACYVNLGTAMITSNNISDDTTSPDTAFRNLSVAFVDGTTAPYDLHLNSGDTSARGSGADLSSLFTDDVDGQTRTGTWDIGADEFIATTIDMAGAAQAVMSGLAALATAITIFATGSVQTTVSGSITSPTSSILESSVTISPEARGIIDTSIPLRGNASALLGGFGNIQADPELTDFVQVRGSLSTASALNGAVRGVASAVSILTTPIDAWRMNSDAAMATTASGAITTSIRPTAQASASVQSIGSLTTSLRLAGGASIAAVAAADLRVPAPNAVGAVAAATSTCAGSLSTSIRMRGDALVTAISQGSAAADVALRSVAASEATVHGVFTGEIHLSGAAQSVASAHAGMVIGIAPNPDRVISPARRRRVAGASTQAVEV